MFEHVTMDDFKIGVTMSQPERISPLLTDSLRHCSGTLANCATNSQKFSGKNCHQVLKILWQKIYSGINFTLTNKSCVPNFGAWFLLVSLANCNGFTLVLN